MSRIIMRIVRSSFFKYVITGLLTVGVDLGLLIVLKEAAHIEVYLAATISFWTSLVVNFSLNKLWTFGIAFNTSQQVVLYSILITFNYIAGLGMIDLFQTLGLGYIAGKIGALTLTTVWNFVLYKKVIFTERSIVTHMRSKLQKGTSH